MRKLRVMEHMSLDGVIQHSADGGGFAYSDWTVPYRTLAGRDAVIAEYGEKFALLLGRRTYDLWAGFWPTAAASVMGDRLNGAKKFVVTHRPESLEWGPAEGIGPDVVGDVRRMKGEAGADLMVAGSSTLTSVLLEAGLVDELVLVTYPVLLGVGKRLFAEGTPAQTFELVKTWTTPTGVMLSTYRAVGALKVAGGVEART